MAERVNGLGVGVSGWQKWHICVLLKNMRFEVPTLTFRIHNSSVAVSAAYLHSIPTMDDRRPKFHNGWNKIIAHQRAKNVALVLYLLV